MSAASQTLPPAIPAGFLTALIANTIWINLSEVFRYFVFVMPMMREAFPTIPDVAAMSLPIFLIWGLWDMILVVSVTTISTLLFERLGSTLQTVFIAGTFVWATIFVILWLGLWNMALATLPILAVALPLAWFEMVIAAFITHKCLKKQG